jgi:hypothetical protein
MSVPAPRRPSRADGRWETIRYALDSNARTFRLCMILLVTITAPVAAALVGVLIRHLLLCSSCSPPGRRVSVGAADGDRALAARQVSRALRRAQIEIEELLEEASAAG